MRWTSVRETTAMKTERLNEELEKERLKQAARGPWRKRERDIRKAEKQVQNQFSGTKPTHPMHACMHVSV
jgi:hypothetical protein